MHCSIAHTVCPHFGCLRCRIHYCRAFAADLQSIPSSDLKCWIPWQQCHWTQTICHSFETLYFSLWCSCNNVLRLLSLSGRAHQPAGTHTCHYGSVYFIFWFLILLGLKDVLQMASNSLRMFLYRLWRFSWSRILLFLNSFLHFILCLNLNLNSFQLSLQCFCYQRFEHLVNWHLGQWLRPLQV